MTPEKAGKSGCDYIVVGRPITQAEEPVAAYRRAVKDFLAKAAKDKSEKIKDKR